MTKLTKEFHQKVTAVVTCKEQFLDSSKQVYSSGRKRDNPNPRDRSTEKNGKASFGVGKKK